MMTLFFGEVNRIVKSRKKQKMRRLSFVKSLRCTYSIRIYMGIGAGGFNPSYKNFLK
jgi:hypothetical protein